MSENQPVITVKFKPLFYSEKDGIIELGEEQETLKTFDVDKANVFLVEYKNKNKYKIEMLAINDIGELLGPDLSKPELLKQLLEKLG